MYDFVIGVDRRTHRLGADLERHLRVTYDYWNFIVEGMRGGLDLTTVRALAQQTDCLLEGIVDFPAKYYVALSTATLVQPSPAGPVPKPMTVLTAIDDTGLVIFDCIESLGHWVPPTLRNYSKYRCPDLLDFVSAVVYGLSNPELIPA